MSSTWLSRVLLVCVLLQMFHISFAVTVEDEQLEWAAMEEDADALLDEEDGPPECQACSMLRGDSAAIHATSVAGSVTKGSMCACFNAVKSNVEHGLLDQRQLFKELCEDKINDEALMALPVEPQMLPFLYTWTQHVLPTKCGWTEEQNQQNLQNHEENGQLTGVVEQGEANVDPVKLETDRLQEAQAEQEREQEQGQEQTEETPEKEDTTILDNGSKIQSSNPELKNNAGDLCLACSMMKGNYAELHAKSVAGSVSKGQMCQCFNMAKADLQHGLLDQRQLFKELCEDMISNTALMAQPAEPQMLPFLNTWTRALLKTKCGWEEEAAKENTQQQTQAQDETQATTTQNAETQQASTLKTTTTAAAAAPSPGPMNVRNIWDD